MILKRQATLITGVFFAFFMVLMASSPLNAATGDPVLINEVLASHTGTDNTEFIELFGTPGTSLDGLSLVVVEGDSGTSQGTIDRQLDFGPADVIGDNGFFLVGNPAGLLANYGVTPNLDIADNYLENSSLTVALVETSSLTGTSVSGSEVALDAVGITDGGSGDAFYFGAPVIGPDGTFFPAGVRRAADGVDTDTAADWVISDFNLGSANTPTAGEFGPATFIVLNEVLASHTGTDNTEFIELFGTPGTSLDGLSLVVVEGDSGTSQGTIDRQLDFGPADAIGNNGFFLVGNPAGLLANYGVTPNLDIADNYLENSSLTVALVETSSLTGTSVSGSEVALDAVGITDGGSGDAFYFGAPVIGPDGTFFPAGVRRVVDGVDTDTAADWVISDFNLGSANTPTAGEFGPGALVLNEVLASHTGTDDTEFIEIFGTPGTSLDGLSLVVVEGDSGTSQGTIDRQLDFGPADVIGDNGFFLVGNPAGLLANYGVIPNRDIANNYLENSSLTVALVETSSLAGTSVSGSEIAVDAVGITDGGSGDAFYFGAPVIGPDGSFFPAGVRRVVDGVDTDTAADWVISDFNLGSANTPTAGTGIEPPAAEVKIHEIQGSGTDTPLLDQRVAIEGIVVGDFQNNGNPDSGDLRGFFVQEEEADYDGNPATSEGIFVFDNNGDVDVSAGDLVQVTGTATEFFGMTQISSLSEVIVVSSGNPLPAATAVSLPADLEPVEGMYVTFPQDLYISEFFNFDRFGEIVLTTARQFQPTAIFDPGTPESAALAAANQANRITLDDGRTSQNPDPAIHPNGLEFTLDNRFRGGDIVQNTTGVINYSFDLFRIQPTMGATYVPQNPRTEMPDDVGGSMTVVAFNVLNYFNTIDDGVNDICGPDQTLECRGADNVEERERQLAKIVSAMLDINADVYGLIELENTAGVEAMTDIVDGLNAVLGAGTYAYVDTGTIGTDAIKQGFLYKTTTVTPVGSFAVLDTPEFVAPNTPGDPKSRPALAQTFMENANGAKVTVSVNHLKSKGSGCGPGDDDPEAGSCNLTRTLAAQELVRWLATDPTGSGDPDVLIIGDLNSYDKEDPIDVLKAAGYSDLLFDYEGEEAYSYVFDGQLGYLDYGMSSATLTPQVTGATAWHINSDEPDILDYDTSFKQDAQDALYEPNAYRSSDHDPVIVGLNLNAPPICGTAFPSFSELWPVNHKMVTVDILGVTDPDGDPFTLTIDSIFQDEPVDGTGDGSTAPDGEGLGTSQAQLRAERDGGGNGRVYYVTFTATDSFGNSCSGEITVSVPQNQGKNGAAVGDGPLFDATVAP